MAQGDIKLKYGAATAYTISLASLASDANLLAGRESTKVDNDAANTQYLDFIISGKITTGTTPTDARQIEVWAYGIHADTPVFPDVLDGTDSNETITSSQIKYAGLVLLAVLPTNNTSDRTYWMRPVSLAQAFGGIVPKQHGLFVVHNTGVALNATAGNHEFLYTPVYANAAAA